MSELLPENNEERLTKLSSTSGDYDIYAPHVTVFTYKGNNSMFDNMYIKHPDNEKALYYWRYETDTGKESEDFDRVKWLAISLGSRAILNLDEELEQDKKILDSDRETYAIHALADLEDLPPEELQA